MQILGLAPEPLFAPPMQLLRRSTLSFSGYSLANTESTGALTPVEFINSLSPCGLPPQRLLLKEHASNMLLRNTDVYNVHVNGARYASRALHNHVVVAVIATGTHTGKETFLPRIPFTPSVGIHPFQMKRKQFPIRLAPTVTYV